MSPGRRTPWSRRRARRGRGRMSAGGLAARCRPSRAVRQLRSRSRSTVRGWRCRPRRRSGRWRWCPRVPICSPAAVMTESAASWSRPMLSCWAPWSAEVALELSDALPEVSWLPPWADEAAPDAGRSAAWLVSDTPRARVERRCAPIGRWPESRGCRTAGTRPSPWHRRASALRFTAVPRAAQRQLLGGIADPGRPGRHGAGGPGAASLLARQGVCACRQPAPRCSSRTHRGEGGGGAMVLGWGGSGDSLGRSRPPGSRGRRGEAGKRGREGCPGGVLPL